MYNDKTKLSTKLSVLSKLSLFEYDPSLNSWNLINFKILYCEMRKKDDLVFCMLYNYHVLSENGTEIKIKC